MAHLVGCVAASVMRPRRCHEYGTSWWREGSCRFSLGDNGAAPMGGVALAVGGAFDDEGVRTGGDSVDRVWPDFRR